MSRLHFAHMLVLASAKLLLPMAVKWLYNT